MKAKHSIYIEWICVIIHFKTLRKNDLESLAALNLFLNLYYAIAEFSSASFAREVERGSII